MRTLVTLNYTVVDISQGQTLQVTFLVGSDNEKVEVRHVMAGSLDLALFTHSFLGLGQDSAQQLSLKTAGPKPGELNATVQVLRKAHTMSLRL